MPVSPVPASTFRCHQPSSLQSGSLTGRGSQGAICNAQIEFEARLAQVSEGGSLDFGCPTQSGSPPGLQFDQHSLPTPEVSILLPEDLW